MHPVFIRRISVFMAAVLVATTTTQPALAAGPGAPPPAAPVAAPIPDPPIPDPPPGPHPGTEIVAMRLVELGWSASDAAVAAAELTPQDLEVLVAYPDMMQNAGNSDTYTAGIIVGLLLLGALIAIAAAGDGSISFSSS